MARIARVVVGGYPHHVTQRGVRSLDIFTSDHDREVYLELMEEHCRKCRVEVLAWCLMTNHVHLVMVPGEERMLARAVAGAHVRYTRFRNFSEGVRGYLFQGRFGSCVLDERHLLAAARYAELNPVRAGLVERAEQWRWSSARYHLGRAAADPLVADRTLMGLVRDARGWREFLAEEDAEAEGRVLRAVLSGRPAGERAFVARLEKRTGRELWPRRAGRKPRRGRI